MRDCQVLYPGKCPPLGKHPSSVEHNTKLPNNTNQLFVILPYFLFHLGGC